MNTPLPGRNPEVITHASADELAEATAARLVSSIVAAQTSKGSASIVLTGGGVGTKTLSTLAGSAARDSVDWSALDVWWGDERFVPSGSDERNSTGAREALLNSVPIPPDRVHPMPASDGIDGADVEAAAARYAAELSDAAGPGRDVPAFDVLLLGVGPDGHVASLFPELPGVHETERTVVGVHGAPKPPPTRISLTFPAINAATEIWLLVAGEEKAGAVRMALGDAGPVQIPAAGVHGIRRTLWLVDHAAAPDLPA